MADQNSNEPDIYRDLIKEVLRLPIAAISFETGSRLQGLYPGRALITGDSCSFDILKYAEEGHCELAPRVSIAYNEVTTGWAGPNEGITHELASVWYEARWSGKTFDVLLLSWPQGYTTESRYWIIGESQEIAEAFFVTVCEWNAEVRGEVLVYSDGRWSKNRKLFESIQSATFDSLVLPAVLKEEIRSDISRFFASREQYERYGVPWKRGILLIGPPGNGKTHTVKALLNAANVPCLYVKSFKSEYGTEHGNIRSVFERARKTTPCILVLEDLDSLIDGGNRSFFLNELDGFASNTGIVTLATTNHPERLDTAIVDRPSRFDRKYHFELPAIEERRTYLARWNSDLQPELRLSEAGIERIAEATDGFSFAYLKELLVSAIMKWINATDNGVVAIPNSMDTVAHEQTELLRAQMQSTSEVQDEPSDDDDAGGFAGMSAAAMMRAMRRARRGR